MDRQPAGTWEPSCEVGCNMRENLWGRGVSVATKQEGFNCKAIRMTTAVTSRAWINYGQWWQNVAMCTAGCLWKNSTEKVKSPPWCCSECVAWNHRLCCTCGKHIRIVSPDGQVPRTYNTEYKRKTFLVTAPAVMVVNIIKHFLYTTFVFSYSSFIGMLQMIQPEHKENEVYTVS